MDENRLAALSGQHLQNLHDNAVRLAQSGTPKQRTDAEALLPSIAAELERRRVDKAVAAEAKRQEKRDRAEASAAARSAAEKLAKAAKAANEPETGD